MAGFFYAVNSHPFYLAPCTLYLVPFTLSLLPFLLLLIFAVTGNELVNSA